MDKRSVNELIDILKHVFQEKKSHQFNNEVLLEFVDSHRNNISPQMQKTLEHFDELSNTHIGKNNRSAIIASKGRLSVSQNLLSTSSNDEEININTSNISFRDHQHKPDKTISRGSSVSDASLGGSPLKMECFADLSSLNLKFNSSNNKRIEKYFVGVDIQEARHLISMYTVSCKNTTMETNSFPSLWVLCNPPKRPPSQYVVIMGVEPLENSSDENRTNKSLKLVKVTMSREATDAMNFHTLPFSLNEKHDIICQAKYDMMDKPRQPNEVLTVLVEWKNPSRLLERFPAYAKVTLFACISSGCEQSPAHKLYLEVTMLQNIINAMNSGDIVWMVDNQEESLIEAVKNLVECMKLNDDVDDEVEESDNDADILQHENSLDLDFTDKLWSVLVACCSMTDLVESLQYVFTCLKNKEIQPFLHSKNKTTLAGLVRESYRNEMRIPSLKGALPLTIMAEIGIEKLQNDYVTFFVSNSLATIGCLAFYVDKNLDLESKIEMLNKLHYIMEMVSAMKIFLPLDQVVMGLIVKQMLHQFENNRLIECHTFEFSLPTGSVLSVLADRMPSIWKAELIGDMSSKMCLLSTSQPFYQLQGIPEVHVENGLDLESEKKKRYYMVIKQESVV